MSQTLDPRAATPEVRFDEHPPAADPFIALRYHFGMLLGVEDFETEQSYHRGKNRLHNAWLHRDGVVWGFRVSAPLVDGEYRDELAVSAGLALDGAGNELHLASTHCVDLSDWYEAQKAEGRLGPEGEMEEADGTTRVKIEARVVVRFRSCLMRPVPALMEPCEGSGGDTAYSRAYETVDLRLEPLPAGSGEPTPEPYHLVRLLLGLDEAMLEEGEPVDADARVLQARDGIRAEGDPEARRVLALDAFRRAAAADVTAMRPPRREGEPSGIFPGGGRPPLVLADVMLRLTRGAEGGRWRILEIDIDNEVRPSHLATRSAQELLCTLLLGESGSAPASPAGPPGSEASWRRPGVASEGSAPTTDGTATGPRIDPGSVHLEGSVLEFRTSGPLSARSVTPEAIEVHAFDRRGGWSRRGIVEVEYDARRRRVRVELDEGGNGEVLRIRVDGSGPTPLLGSDLSPLAGSTSGPPLPPGQGGDFTHMLSPRS